MKSFYIFTIYVYDKWLTANRIDTWIMPVIILAITYFSLHIGYYFFK